MNSVYNLENLFVPGQQYDGVELRCTLRTTSVPSNYTIKLRNASNEASFNWTPHSMCSSFKTLQSFTNPMNEVQPNPVWRGNQDTKAISAPYNNSVSLVLRAQGNEAYSQAKMAGIQTEVYGSFYGSFTNGWMVEITSDGVGQPSNTIMEHFSISADGSAAGSTSIVQVVLTPADIANKYIDLSDPFATSVSVNLDVSTSLAEGIDYALDDGKIIWGGYGLDVPELVPGLVLRVVYYAGAYGVPNIHRVGKRLIGIGGHGI